MRNKEDLELTPVQWIHSYISNIYMVKTCRKRTPKTSLRPLR